MNVFPFIEAEKAEQRNVAKACALLEVSRSAFYDWHQAHPVGPGGRRRRARRADRADLRRLAGHLRLAAGASGAAPRRRARGRQAGGADHAPARVWSAGAGAGGPRPRSPTRTSTAVDLLKRAFGPGTVELDRVYVGDITYIWTWEGWAYLATVIDLASRRVVGWAMADHMRAELVCDALRMAIDAPPAGARADLPLRPRHPVHQHRVHRPARRARDRSSRCRGPGNAGTTPSPRASSRR